MGFEFIELKQHGLKKQTIFRENIQGRLLCVGKALCEDGSQRMAKATSEPDTYFSIPAKVSVKGKTVTGFLTVSTIQGYSTPTEDDPAIWKFIAYKYRKNWKLLQPKEENVQS